MKLRIVRAVAAIPLLVTVIGCASNQPPSAETPKTGKTLVERLPAGIEGVDLMADAVRTKPEFRWEKQPDGTVMVKRTGGGGGGGLSEGTWTCECDSGPYECEPVIYKDEGFLRCERKVAGQGCLKCVLKVRIKTDNKTAIIAY